MFNAARASLLAAGIYEGNLPRTHNGVIAAFGKYAVQTGRVESKLGRSFNEAEVLRLRADYTGVEISAKAAEDVVSRAALFVRTVEHEFGLAPSARENLGMESTDTTEKAEDRDNARERDTDLDFDPDR